MTFLLSEHQKRLRGHTSTVRSLLILNDKRRALSSSRDNTVRLWDIAEGVGITVLTAHSETVRTIALSEDESLLLSGSNDGSASVCRVESNDLVLLHTLRGHDAALYCVDFVKDGAEHAVTAGRDTTIRVWDMKDG